MTNAVTAIELLPLCYGDPVCSPDLEEVYFTLWGGTMRIGLSDRPGSPAPGIPVSCMVRQRLLMWDDNARPGVESAGSAADLKFLQQLRLIR
jgi:hypothetical protein